MRSRWVSGGYTGSYLCVHAVLNVHYVGNFLTLGTRALPLFLQPSPSIYPTLSLTPPSIYPTSPSPYPHLTSRSPQPYPSPSPLTQFVSERPFLPVRICERGRDAHAVARPCRACTAPCTRASVRCNTHTPPPPPPPRIHTHTYMHIHTHAYTPVLSIIGAENINK